MNCAYEKIHKQKIFNSYMTIPKHIYIYIFISTARVKAMYSEYINGIIFMNYNYNNNNYYNCQR